MISFELKRYIKKKHLFYTILAVVLILGINIALELATGELNGAVGLKLKNVSQAISQFSIIALLPILSDTFSTDYQNRNIFFFFQNNISAKTIYLSKIFVYNLMTGIVYAIALIAFFFQDILVGNKTVFIVILLNLLIVLSSVNLSLFFSMLFKKRWMVIGAVLFIWFLSQVINALKVPYVSGLLLPVDGNNNVALYIASLIGEIVNYKNLIKSLPVNLQAIIICLFWILVPILLGVIISNKQIKKNAI